MELSQNKKEIAEIIALAVFMGGYFAKGLLTAIVSEIIFRPMARKIKKRADKWEKTHPHLLKWSLHYLDNHKGLRPSQCKEGRCKPHKKR